MVICGYPVFSSKPMWSVDWLTGTCRGNRCLQQTKGSCPCPCPIGRISDTVRWIPQNILPYSNQRHMKGALLTQSSSRTLTGANGWFNTHTAKTVRSLARHVWTICMYIHVYIYIYKYLIILTSWKLVNWLLPNTLWHAVYKAFNPHHP